MELGSLIRGTEVTVVAYGGERLRRRVWQDLGSGVLLCSEREYQRALGVGDEPQYSGFPKEDVVAVHSGPALEEAEHA
jgi:hypothetical protein